jgi:hypothetical protein
METVTFLLRKKNETRVKTYPSQKTVREIMQEEKCPTGVLLFDGSSNITRIGFEDPINHYFGGQENDIYRIEDQTSMRYRIVYNLTDKNTARDVKKTVAPLSPEEMFLRARKTLLELYTDRQYRLETDATEEEGGLLLEGVNATNRRLYTISIELEYMKKNIGHLFKNELLLQILERIRETFPVLPEFDFEKIDQSCAEYAKYAHILVVYDNPAKMNLPVKMKHHHVFLQFMAIQQLQFNISRHVSQPKMTLLDRSTDREEILELYRLNGEELRPEKTLGDYAITQETKLIII